MAKQTVKQSPKHVKKSARTVPRRVVRELRDRALAVEEARDPAGSPP
jgi:predicted PP-loop superfamily ATPase